MQRARSADGDDARALLSGLRVSLVAEPSPAIRAVEDALRGAGAAVICSSPTAGKLRASSCDVVVAHLSGPLPDFAPDRTLVLVDEPAAERLEHARDFVLAPFRPDEVVARVARMLSPVHGEPMLTAGNLELRTASRTASVGGRVVDLTFHEFEILRLLLATNGSVLSRDDMVRHLARAATPDSRWVDIHIHRLRSKLRPLRGASIETVRGVGYRLSRH